MIPFYNSRDNWVSRMASRSHAIAVREDASYVNFFSWTGDIDQIIKKYNFFSSWHMTWWNNTWQFLQCHALEIAKTGLLRM
mmetsp:Transcript_27814/g.85331  ORF Transcript_27814/g.85331 Transcript_27814/m.85331 type:complete len:81 (-) Transcript_27814:1053-1295(-)